MASPDTSLDAWSGSEAPAWSFSFALVALLKSVGLAVYKGFA